MLPYLLEMVQKFPTERKHVIIARVLDDDMQHPRQCIFRLSVIRTQDILHQSGEGLLCWRHACLQLDGESAMASMLVIGKRGKASIGTCALRRLWQSCNRSRMQCPTQPNPFCPSPGSRRPSGSTAFLTRRSSRRPTSSSAGTLPRSPSASSPSLGS